MPVSSTVIGEVMKTSEDRLEVTGACTVSMSSASQSSSPAAVVTVRDRLAVSVFDAWIEAMAVTRQWRRMSSSPRPRAMDALMMRPSTACPLATGAVSK